MPEIILGNGGDWILGDLVAHSNIMQACHPRECRGQIFADQLTLSQTGGADYAYDFIKGQMRTKKFAFEIY